MAAALALLLTACASPPDDGIPRVHKDGRWVIQGHSHEDAVVHLDQCQGCGDAMSAWWGQELLRRQKAAQEAQRAQAAPIDTQTKKGAAK